VLFPGGPLPLRIFETRYLDMISRCMKDDVPFGVLLIREGYEAGAATTFDVGTLARIVDWYQGSDGLLGVTAMGEERFRLLASSRRHDGLNIGDVELLPGLPSVPLDEKYRGLAAILANVLDELGLLYESLSRHYDDAVWVAYRLAEVLPVELPRKQVCLESSDIDSCLEMIDEMIKS